MEEHAQKIVKLLHNRVYPTYQLYAAMDNKKTAARDGLRLAALAAMEWLRQRLDGAIPPELDQPGPDQFRAVGDERLKSFHVNCGYLIDIVSLPEDGLWTLQVVEPDLGPEPGNPELARRAVPGRVIETNIGFRVTCGGVLECGFQVLISDPATETKPAGVYRPVLVRRLMENPDFGLRQIAPLSFEAERVNTVEQIKNLLDMRRENQNHLPAAVFTYARQKPEEPETALSLGSLPRVFPRAPQNMELPRVSGLPAQGKELPMEEEPAKKQPKVRAAAPLKREAKVFLPYDVDAFARETAAFARTFLLKDELLDRFNALAETALRPGDMIFLEPARFGGEELVFSYRPSRSRQEDAFRRLREAAWNYPRDKKISFGTVTFLSRAREDLMEAIERGAEENETFSQQVAMDFQALEERWKAVVAEKERECHELREQIARVRSYQARLEREKEELRVSGEAALEDLRAQFHGGREIIEYLRRKLEQPAEHARIAAWVKENFPDRLILHPKAIALLEDKSAQTVDVGLICDALDFLATDYWENRYLRVPDDQMKTRCSKKYGRPFEIKPTGETTIQFTPGQYKIKYFLNERTKKPMETPLSYHLRVGSDPENLLRIYFLHDDEKRLIVVGSLPKHLRAVSIK